MLEKTLESPLDWKEIQPVHPKGNQVWVFIGRTDVEAETPILWPPDAKNWLIGRDTDAGNYWRQEEKGTTEDEMVGWHCRLDGHEFEQAPEVGDGQGSLACCSPWVAKSWTRLSNWTELNPASNTALLGHRVQDLTNHLSLVSLFLFTSAWQMSNNLPSLSPKKCTWEKKHR